MVTMPEADATTVSPSSAERFQSIDRIEGLWLPRVEPVQVWPHGNGIWCGVTGTA